ncbi:MAG TPA: phytanoyl-CoA dioxygenase family protein [Armatimonadota bacterium]|jgi:ectoine hydroxylase-related dioxygenase (phytanoyl-CoA dioxygenase family)
MADASGPLSIEALGFYRTNGYVVVENFLTPAELADISAAVDDAYAKHYSYEHDNVGANPAYDAVFLQKVNLWQVHEGIRRHTFSPKLAACARQLLEAGAVRIWHDQTLVKEPNSLPTPFHQDLPYWPMIEDTALTAWTALDDVDERNSCMQYIPGSQTWGRLPGVDFSSPQGVAEVAPEHAAECVPVSAPVPAGSVVFHHSLTFHGATANVTERRRRAMIVHYMADGTRFNGQEHIVSKIMLMKPGDPMDDDAIWPLTP